MQNVVVGDETGNKLKHEVIRLIDLTQIINYCLLAVGAVLLLCGCLLLAACIYQRRRQRRHSVTITTLLIDDDDDDDDDDVVRHLQIQRITAIVHYEC